MLAYKPKEEPVLTKIVKSGLFQFLMVVALGVGVTTFVVRTDQPQQWIQKINRFASVTPNPQAKTEAGIAEDQAEFEAPPPEANTWSARAASPTETLPREEGLAAMAMAAAAPNAAGTQESVSPTATASAPVKLRVQMVEIDYEYLNGLLNERNGSLNNIGGDVAVFRSFPNIQLDQSKIKNLRTDSLDYTSVKTNSVASGNSSHWIRFTANVVDLQASTKFFDAAYIKNHPNDNQQIPVELNLRGGELYIISGRGLLTYFDVEPALADVAPFTVFKSVDYRNQKTTFAIIVQLQ